VCDERLGHVLVVVADVDIAGAGRVRGLGDGTDQRRVLDRPVDEHDLVQLHVGADADDQLGVADQLRLERAHAAQLP
jgi:hypothetical protein